MSRKKLLGIFFNKKIIVIFTMVVTLLVASYKTKQIVLLIKNQEIEESSKLYNVIDKKFNFLSMICYEVKNNNIFKDYFLEENNEANKRYKRIVLNEYLRKINTVYGELGVTIELFKKTEELVFSNVGTINKKEYFRKNKILKNIKDNNKYIIKNKEKITIVLPPNKYEKNKEVYWIITLRKDIFFIEIYSQLDNWYLTSNDIILNLGDLDNITKEKITKYGKKYKTYYLDENLIYLPKKINVFEIFSYEFFKVGIFLSIIYLIIYLIGHFIIIPIQNLAYKIGCSGKSIKQEVQFIEDKMEEIALTNKNLQYTIDDMKEYQTSKKIKDYLIGLTDIEDLYKLTKDVPILKFKKYRLIILEVFDVETTENIYDKINLSKGFVKKYFEQDVACEVIWLDYKSIIIILEDDYLEEEELEEVMKCLSNHCERNFNLVFTIAITQQHTTIEDMSKSYKEAKKILDYKFAFKQKRVIFFKDICKEDRQDYYYPIELEAKLITRVLNSNEIGIKKVLDEIFDENNIAKIDKKKIKEFEGLLYNTLNRIFIQLNRLNEESEIQPFNSDDILKVNDLKQLKKIFNEKIYELYKISKLRDLNDVFEIKEKIIKFLEENYHIDISLENLADYLGHSFRYTSVLFKKVMDDNFKSYLNIYRVEKAKELMMEDNEIKVKDLAERVGYNSSNTFIRIFKKYEGVSPGKYLEDIK